MADSSRKSFEMVLVLHIQKAASQRCTSAQKRRSPEEDNVEVMEATKSWAAAKEISVDTVVTAVFLLRRALQAELPSGSFFFLAKSSVRM